MSYIVPLKKDLKIIKDNLAYDDLDTPIKHKDEILLGKVTKVDDKTFLYSFKDGKIAKEEEDAYLKKHVDDFDKDEYEEEKKRFGVIVFRSNKELSLSEVYEAYDSRWEIETMFKTLKGILDLDTVNVHSDYSNIATHFINFLSVIIATKIKNKCKNTYIETSKGKKKEGNKKPISDLYSYKQIMRYLRKVKKIKTNKDGEWKTNYPENCLYLEELCKALGV